MLRKNADRCRVYCAIDYDLQIGNELSEAAKKVHEKHKPDSVRVGVQGYNFAWPSKRQLCVVSIQRLAFQTLGLSSWTDGQKVFESIYEDVIQTLGIQQLKRIGLKILAFIPLSMTHPEMCELMFGSFLAGKEKLQKVCGDPQDPLLKLDGEFNDMHYNLIVSPMRPEHATTTLRGTENLDLFLQDKYLDSGLLDFFKRIQKSDSFYFDIDFFKRDINASSLNHFLDSSLKAADQIAEACIRNLQSKPIKN